MLNYGPVLHFVKEHVLPMELSKKEKKSDSLDLKILNVLSNFASGGVAKTLWNYLSYVNVAEEDRPFIKMKNEYFYPKMIITFAMKSYIAWLVRQEHVVLPEPKLDVKGVNFFKSTASKETSDFIYQKILIEQLLAPKSGEISLESTYRAIYEFQKHITGEIKSGNMGFLKQSIKVKSPDAYANPMRAYQSKAVWIWNYLNDEMDHIQTPGIVTLVKVKLQNKQDAAALAPWPQIYEKVIHLFETNPEVGDYTVIKDGKERKMKGKGIKSIALPTDYEEVPDWVLAIIDVESLVVDNLRLFDQLMKPLGMTPVNSTFRGTTRKYFSNIIRI